MNGNEPQKVRDKIDKLHDRKHLVQVGAIAAGAIATILQTARILMDQQENKLSEELDRELKR